MPDDDDPNRDHPDRDDPDQDDTLPDGATRPTGTRERQPEDADEVERSRERAEDLRRTNSPVGDQGGIVPTRRQDST